MNGVAEFFDTVAPFDIHVFPGNAHATSVYGVSLDDVLIHCSQPFLAELSVEKEDTLLPENQTFIGDGDVLTGALDCQNYRKGERLNSELQASGWTKVCSLSNFDCLSDRM